MSASFDGPIGKMTERRGLLRRDMVRLGILAAPAAVLAACGDDDDTPSPSPSPSPSGLPVEQFQADIDAYHLLQVVSHLEAQVFSFSAFGVGLAPELTRGVTDAGTITGGAAVPFGSERVAMVARELALSKIDQLRSLRNVMDVPYPPTLITPIRYSVASPQIDISSSEGGGFTPLFRQASVVRDGERFDPYASEENWLLAALLLADVSTAVFRTLAPRIVQRSWRAAALTLLGTASNASGAIRHIILRREATSPGIAERANRISALRETLDGAQAVERPVGSTAGPTEIAPTDADGGVPGRTASGTLNILYASRQAVQRGGFFPASIPGNIKTSGVS